MMTRRGFFEGIAAIGALAPVFASVSPSPVVQEFEKGNGIFQAGLLYQVGCDFEFSPMSQNVRDLLISNEKVVEQVLVNSLHRRGRVSRFLPLDIPDGLKAGWRGRLGSLPLVRGVVVWDPYRDVHIVRFDALAVIE